MPHTNPTVGGDADSWGPILNDALDDIQADADAAASAASTAQLAADGKVDPSDLSTVATSGAYTDLTGKPAIPDSPDDIGAAAATHSHTEAQVTGLTTDLAGKAAASHTHPESDVTNLATDLAGKAAASHTHAEADTTNLTTDLAAKLPKAGGTMTGAITMGSHKITGVSPATAAGDAVEYSQWQANLGGGGTVTSNNITDATTTGKAVLTAADAAAARTAVGAGTSSFSGAYTDLTGKPTLAAVATSGAATDLTGTLGVAHGGTGVTNFGTVQTAWSPAVTGGGTATYTSNGQWCQIAAKVVFVQGVIVFTADGSGSTNVNVSLPVEPDRTTRANLVFWIGDTITVTFSANGYTLAGATGAVIDRIRRVSSQTDTRLHTMTGADIVNGMIWSFSGMYFTV